MKKTKRTKRPASRSAWRTYEDRKAKLFREANTPEEYQAAIRRITNELNL